MKKHDGLATLSIVLALLSLIIVMTLSVAMSGLSRVKMTQNLAVKMEQSATAQAGLDCGIAIYQENKLLLDDIKQLNQKLWQRCGVPIGLEQIQIEKKLNHWQLMSSKGYAVRQLFIKEKNIYPSAFKTAGSLYIHGGQKWQPAKVAKVEEKNGVNYFICSAILAGGDIIIDLTDSEKMNTVFTSDLHSMQNEKCDDNTNTDVQSGRKIKNGQVNTLIDGDYKGEGYYESDIRDNYLMLELFHAYFAHDKQEWESIQNGFDFIINTHSDIDVADCGDEIIRQRNKIARERPTNETLITIWINGDCYLGGLDSDAFKNPVFVVVKDGVIGSRSPIANFNGSFFQFSFERHSFLETWLSSKSESATCKDGPFKLLCEDMRGLVQDALGSSENVWSKLPFLFEDGFQIKGGFVQDIPNSISYIRGVFDVNASGELDKYRHEIEERFQQPIAIMQGGFHDF